MIPTPTAEPPATPSPTPPLPPTLIPPNSAHRYAETTLTVLGSQVDIVVEGFDDNHLRFVQLVLVINEAEKLLGVPYPAPSVLLLRVLDLASTSYCGTFLPGHAPDYHVADGATISMRVDEDCWDAFGAIVHETVHTWFHGSAAWIDEGLTTAVERQILSAHRDGYAAYPPVTYCESYRNILDLEQGDASVFNWQGPSAGFGCSYRFGDGLLWDLQTHYGTAEFNRRIALLAWTEGDSMGRQYTIAHIRDVFSEAPALALVNLWYEGVPEMRKYGYHWDAVEWAIPPTVSGGVLTFSGKVAWGAVDLNYQEDTCFPFSLREYDGGIYHHVATLATLLPEGWAWPDDHPAVLTEGQSDSDGSFSATVQLSAELAARSGSLLLVVAEQPKVNQETGECDSGDWLSVVELQ